MYANYLIWSLYVICMTASWCIPEICTICHLKNLKNGKYSICNYHNHILFFFYTKGLPVISAKRHFRKTVGAVVDCTMVQTEGYGQGLHNHLAENRNDRYSYGCFLLIGTQHPTPSLSVAFCRSGKVKTHVSDSLWKLWIWILDSVS